MKFEEEMNNRLREVFVDGFPENAMRCNIMDDDKFVYQTPRNSETYNMKVSQHVRKNRRCFTNHQIVNSASGTLCSATFER